MPTDLGANVYAISSGRVVKIYTTYATANNPDVYGLGTGNSVIFVEHTLQDGSKFLAEYMHVQPTVSENQTVNGDDIIAHVGPYQYSSPHLHFGIHPSLTVPTTNWGRMSNDHWADPYGFVDPVGWITSHIPQGAGNDDAGFKASPGQSSSADVTSDAITVQPGQAFQYTFYCFNRGTTTWTANTSYALHHNGHDQGWGPTQSYEVVSNTTTHDNAWTKVLQMTAPNQAGTYTLTGRMARDSGGGYQEFGASVNVTVNVSGQTSAAASVLAVRRGALLYYQAHPGDTQGVSTTFGTGNNEDEYLVGDWTGDGTPKLAVRRDALIIYQLHWGDTQGLSMPFGNGNREDEYFVGDWTGDGKSKLAVRRGGTIIYQQHFGDTQGVTMPFGNGNAEDQYLVGDWTGDGKTKFAVRRGGTIIYQQHFGDGGGVTMPFGNGNAEDEYLVGDWTGDGKSKFAVRRDGLIVYQEHFGDGGGVTMPYGSGNIEDQYLTLSKSSFRSRSRPAELTSPSNGAAFASTSIALTWSRGRGNAEYWLSVGSTGVGSNNVVNSSQGTGLSATVNGLPNGTIYVRIFSRAGSTWRYNDYTFSVVDGSTPAEMTSPLDQTTIGTNAAFTWNTGTGNAEYWLSVGTSGVGSNNIMNATQGTGTSKTLSNLPLGALYVRLWWRSASSGVWRSVDYTYTVDDGSPKMTVPASGSAIASSTNFAWSSGTGVLEYWLFVGTTGLNSSNVYNATQGTNLSKTLSNLPFSTVYVRLWWRNGSGWHSTDYSYTVSDGSTPAQLTSPAPGPSLSIPKTTTFSWNTGTENAEYWLTVGTTGVGSNSILSATQGSNTSKTLSSLPFGTLYMRLWSRSTSSGAWHFNDYVFTVTDGSVPAQMTSPGNGDTITTTTTFSWNGGTSNAEYWLSVGTTGVGSKGIINATQGNSTSKSLTNLPFGTIYVRLWSRSTISGTWYYNDYVYTRL